MVGQLWGQEAVAALTESVKVIKRGKDDTQFQQQRYLCKVSELNVDNLIDTIFAEHHQPLRHQFAEIIIVLTFTNLVPISKSQFTTLFILNYCMKNNRDNCIESPVGKYFQK